MSTEMTAHKPKLLEKFAGNYGVDADKILGTLKATAFNQGKESEVTNEQMMALLIVADQYHLNPFTKEIYAFPDKKKGGIVPVVSVDGWIRIINEQPAMNGIEFRYSEAMVDAVGGKKAHEWVECLIYRKDRTQPIAAREYLDEVYRPAINGYAGPWQSHTKRMHRHKALIQASRMAFGFAGIYDQDEAERIVEGEVIRESFPAVTDLEVDVAKVDAAVIRAIEIVDSDDMDSAPDQARELFLTLHMDEQIAFKAKLEVNKGGPSGKKSYFSMFREYYEYKPLETA